MVLWIGQGISQLGDAVIEVTLPVWVGMLTNSPSDVAAVAAAELLPGVLIGPVAGTLVDRWNPRSTMAAADLLRMLVVLSFFFPHGWITIPWIYVVSFLLAVMGSFFEPARNALTVAVVPAPAISRAQALNQSIQSVALIAGPALAAFLLFLAGPRLGAAIDGMSFVVSVLTLLVVLVPHRPQSARVPGRSLVHAMNEMWRELTEGIRLTIGQRGLQTLCLVNAAMAVVGYLWFAVDLFFVSRSLHVPKSDVGFLWAASGAGALLASLVLAVRAERINQRMVLIVGLGIRSAALLWYASMTSVAPAFPATFVAGLGDGLVLISSGGLTLWWAPRGVVGRVTAAQHSIGRVGTLGAFVLLVLFENALSPHQVLLLCALVLGAACLVTWLRFAQS